MRTVYKLHSVIHASLNSAIKLGLLGRNPDDATQPPKLVRKEMRFLNAPQVKSCIANAQQRSGCANCIKEIRTCKAKHYTRYLQSPNSFNANARCPRTRRAAVGRIFTPELPPILKIAFKSKQNNQNYG